LARDVEAGDARRRAGPTLVDDRPQALLEERPHDRRQLDVPADLAGIAIERAPLGALHALHESRLPQHAPVGDGGHEPRDLHRRDQNRALADRHVHALAALPGLAPAPNLRMRQEAELLVAELHAGALAESERTGVLRDDRPADLEP